MNAVWRLGRWFTVHPLVSCVLWALWLSFLYGAFGPHSYVRIFDNADSTLAQYVGLKPSIAGKDAFASWVQAWATGVDRRQMGGLDQLPFVFLPGWLAYWLIMFSQRLLAAYFGYRLARDRWGLGVTAAWFLALSYSAFQQPAINQSGAGWTMYDSLTLAAVPAIAWLLLDPCLSRRRLLLLSVGVGALYAWTSNYPFTVFVMILLGLVLVLSAGLRPRAWLAFGVFAAAWAVAEMPALLAGYLNGVASHRADRAAFSPLTLSLSRQLISAAELVRSNFVGIALGVYAVVFSRDRRAMVAVGVTAAVALAISFSAWGDALLDRYGGPLGNLTFLRLHFLVPFLAAAAGAFGIEALLATPRRTARLVAVAPLVVVIGLSLVTNVQLAANMVRDSNYAAVFEDPALVTLRQEAVDAAPFRVATVVATTKGYEPPQPAFAWAQGIDTADGYLNLYSQRYQDFWERVIAPLTANDQRRDNYYHFWGNRIYLFAPTRGFPPGPIHAGSYYDLDLLSLANVRYLISGVALTDERLREVSAPAARRPRERLLYAWKLLPTWLSQVAGSPVESAYYVYELTDSLPRAFVVGTLRRFPSRDSLLRALALAPPMELRTTVFIEQADGPPPIVGGRGGNAEAIRLSRDQVEVDVESAAAAFVVLTVQYGRFWQATVDGVATRIVPSDGPFMGVAIPAGRHTVTLSYDPPYALPIP